jgi:hypothetical protein
LTQSTKAGTLEVPVKSKGDRDVKSVHDGEVDAVGEAQARVTEALVEVEGRLLQGLVGADLWITRLARSRRAKRAALAGPRRTPRSVTDSSHTSCVVNRRGRETRHHAWMARASA